MATRLATTDFTATVVSEIPVASVQNELKQRSGSVMMQVTFKITAAALDTRSYATGGLPLIDTSTAANGAIYAAGYDPRGVIAAWPNGGLHKSDFTQTIPMHVNFNSAANKLHIVLFQDYPALAGGSNEIADDTLLNQTTYLNSATALAYITLVLPKR